MGCCNADGADHLPSMAWHFTGSTHSAAFPIAQPYCQHPLPSDRIPGKPDVNLSSVPPAGCFPCCLSLRGAAPRIFGKWDIHTRGSHGGDPPHLGVILAGAGGGGISLGLVCGFPLLGSPRMMLGRRLRLSIFILAVAWEQQGSWCKFGLF